MPGNRSTDFKIDTYTRLTKLTKSRLTHLSDIIKNFDTPITKADINKLTNYRNEIQRKHEDFIKNLERVVEIQDNENITEEILASDQNTISDLFIDLTSSIDDLLSSNDDHLSLPGLNAESTTQNQSCSARLPKLELPRFNGNFADWSNFINVFNTTIHKNDTLNKVTKFQYLLSVLSSEPLNLIKNLSLTEANYDIAYEMVFKRYQNDRRLRLLHLNTILDLPDISGRNVSGIRTFVNSYNEHIQALTAIDCDISISNHLLSALLLRKLDMDLRKRLETFRDNRQTAHTLPSAEEILEFLTSECDRHEDAISTTSCFKESHSSHVPEKQFNTRKFITKPVLNSTYPTTKPQRVTLICAGCDSTDHKTYNCAKFLKLSPQDRFHAVKSHRHCISCLGNHNSQTCKSQSVCKHCSKGHNTLLHFPTAELTFTNKAGQSYSHQPHENSHPSNHNTDAQNPITLHVRNPRTTVSQATMVLLGTLLINLRSASGQIQTFRALIDTGSMASLISERAVHLLNTPRNRCFTQIVGISQQSTKTKGQITANIETLSGITLQHNHSFVILDKLTLNIPRCPVAPEVVSRLKYEQLADPNFHLPNRIDVILGASLVPHLFTGPVTSLGNTLPSMINTPCGNIIIGTTPCTSDTSQSCSSQLSTLNMCLHTSSLTDMHDSIQRFWLLEEIPNHKQQSQEDIYCEKLFTDTHTRDEHGRYIVRLPFKTSSEMLGSSINAAEQRLIAMERKFSRNERFSVLYKDFMHEYLSLDHMSLIDVSSLPPQHYYLPHHGVLKESSSTTKLRTVFDASCKTDSGHSLNDLLLTGPALQSNIADILTQFRRHRIVMCSDIKQMYRQIMVHPSDRNYQLILWRDSPNQPMQTYQLNTVTYGMNCSPYLAIRTLHQLATDEGHKYPQAAYAIKHHTYMDDIVTGSDTLEEAIQLKTQLTQLLQCGQFELRKWMSNSEELLQDLPESHRETPKFVSESSCPQFTVLGLQWSHTLDVFSYVTTNLDSNSKLTKRHVLSAIAKIYDPCGFLTPCIMIAKCIMQQIWTLGISWDSILPDSIIEQWKRFSDDTQYLPDITIPRSLNLHSLKDIELHGFADASETGFASLIYFKCIHLDDSVTINFVMAKGRVAPLRRTTIPRLELCAAHLLSKLTLHCTSLFPNMFNTNNIFLWSDSTIVLTWIKTPAYQLKTFVANRVAAIQESHSTEVWHYVNTNDNPADCGSRGLRIKQLVDNHIWWSGPSWLSRPSSDWPKQEHPKSDFNSEVSSELKPTPLPVFVTTGATEWQPLKFYSSWTKLVRIMAIVLRFKHNCLNKQNRVTGFITTVELHITLKIFHAVQSEVFIKEKREKLTTVLTISNHFIRSLMTTTLFVSEDVFKTLNFHTSQNIRYYYLNLTTSQIFT